MRMLSARSLTSLVRCAVKRWPALTLSSLVGLHIIGLAACSGGGDRNTPTPRRQAFPRIAAIDSVYRAVDSLPVRFEVNRAAVTSSPRAGWLDIKYPPYNATIHLAFVRVEPGEMAEELDRRRERMSLNLGGAPAGTTHLTADNGKFECLMLTADDITATPVQILATDGESLIISGAAYLPALTPSTPYDSIAPIIEVLHRDLLHSLKSLQTIK